MEFFDTITAISTPAGSGGVGIIRTSGETAVKIAEPLIFAYNKKKLSEFESHKLVLSQVRSLESSAIIDEALVVVMKAPHSFTGEDVVEIQCHGGYIVAKRILEELIKAGARLAQPGEFTRRAFMNGKTDLLKAEGAADLIYASSYLGAENAAKTVAGDLSEKINALRDTALKLAANISAAADYPDEVEPIAVPFLIQEIESMEKEINRLISGFDTGKILREGITTVIAGRPNVGKSSLLNALLREEKAIVADLPGTTRDIIEDYVNLKGLTLKIIDTAGIRSEADEIEKIGIERAYKNIDSADLCLFIVNASEKIEKEDFEIFRRINKRKYIIVANKTDIKGGLTEEEIAKQLNADKTQVVSTFVPQNGNQDISKLEDKILEMFFTKEISSSEVYITGERQKNALVRAKEALENIKTNAYDTSLQDLLYIDLENLIAALGEITGKTVREEIIDEVFANFCVGK